MGSITFKEIILQLKADLIGKDSHRGITLTYTWIANQFGHFSLGFIPTLLVHAFIINYTKWNHAVVMAALMTSVGWLLFELYNFLGPLLLRNRNSGKRYHFKPEWKNIAFDTFTDLCFFWLGTSSAALYLSPSVQLVFIPIGLALLLIFFGQHWFLTKMYLQAAQYPFHFRLSQWDGTLSDEDNKTIRQFLDDNRAGTHLFIYGLRGSGKTSLGIGVATELSIRHNMCLYSTAMKLFCMFFENEEQTFVGIKNPWTWRDTSLLIVDDISPGVPMMKDLVTAEEFLKIVDTFLDCNDANRSIIRNKRMIWVLGNENPGGDQLNWPGMLEKINVNKEDILIIRLADGNTD